MNITAGFSIKKNLRLLLELHHISEAELCRRTNIKQSTLNRLLTGLTDDPHISTLSAIAKFFNISIDQLIGLKPIPKTLNEEAIPEIAIFIPLLSLADTIDWSSSVTEQQDKYNQWIETESFNKNCFSLKVADDSMWPQFANGTILIVNPTLEPKNRDFIICYLSKEQLVVFRQYINENNHPLLKAINQTFPSVTIGKNDKIVGVITQARNDFKIS